MNKELVYIEFDYLDKPRDDDSGEIYTKTVIIGIYDSFEEAVENGNKALALLKARGFDLRENDKFVNSSESNKRLVSNCCYPTNRIKYFAHIKQMDSSNLSEVINNMCESYKRWKEYKENEVCEL